MTAFAQARADLAETMAKLAALDRVLGMMEEHAAQLVTLGQQPSLSYDAATGRLALEVVVGRVPPRVTVGVEEARPALPPPATLQSPNDVPRDTRLTKFRTGPWSDAELMTAAVMIREGRTNKEIAARLNRTATGIHFQLNPMRAELGEGGDEPPAAVPPPVSLTRAEREVWERLDAISDAAWPASRDLDLVRMLGGGHGAEDAAARWDVPKEQIVSRWNALFPEKTVEAQARMVRVLKARIAAGAAA